MAELTVAPQTLPSPALLTRFASLPAKSKLTLAVGVAALIALAVGMFSYSTRPDYRVLFSNVSDKDGGAIIAQLSQMNVPYQFAAGGGTILVPETRVHETRLKLASQGLPKGSGVGFELLDNQKLGATQFQEQVTFQRALEGELAQSMQSISAVKAARVHLAIPKPSVFLREKEKPTASVLLTLHPGHTLDRSQVAGIKHLVSSSVAELPTQNVSIVDQDGNLLSGPKELAKDAAALDATQLHYTRDIEASLAQRVRDLLEPLVGRDNVRAQVTAEIDFNQVESTAETFKPNADPKDATIRSQQLSESTQGTQPAAQGIPGALSNQPPGNNPTAAQQTNSTSSARDMRKESTINYEVDRTTKVTRQPVGSIKRLSAAIVVNHKPGKAKEGKTAAGEPLSAEELAKLTALVKEAIGFSAQRGDSVNVLNSAFIVESAAKEIDVPLWKDPANVALAKDLGKGLLMAALLVFVLFGLVRPIVRELVRRPDSAQLAASATNPAALPNATDAAALPGAPANVALAQMRQLAQNDPRVVANVVKQWVANG